MGFQEEHTVQAAPCPPRRTRETILASGQECSLKLSDTSPLQLLACGGALQDAELTGRQAVAECGTVLGADRCPDPELRSSPSGCGERQQADHNARAPGAGRGHGWIHARPFLGAATALALRPGRKCSWIPTWGPASPSNAQDYRGRPGLWRWTEPVASGL